MELRGTLKTQGPLYRGNARKTLFTRDGDGKQRLVSLSGEVQGTAQALMDAFIGSDRQGKNKGLLNQLWQRLYGQPMPQGLISSVQCSLNQESYPQDRLFDIRMGIKLDEDRWAIESNANYKLETLYKNSTFDLVLSIDEGKLKQEGVQDRFVYLLEELRHGRFWFGAGKTKGLGRCILDMDLPFSAEQIPECAPEANHLQLAVKLTAQNPICVQWPWGKIEDSSEGPKVIEGKSLIQSLYALPQPLKERLEMGLSGPTTDIQTWIQRFECNLSSVIAHWIRAQSAVETEQWILPREAVTKMGKGKHPLSKKVLDTIQDMVDTPFPSKDAASTALEQKVPKANMIKRILQAFEQRSTQELTLDMDLWQELVQSLGLKDIPDQVQGALSAGTGLEEVIDQALSPCRSSLRNQLERQIRLLQSDAWVDREIEEREAHLKIKEMLLQGDIQEQDWADPHRPPEGIGQSVWTEFLESHARIKFHHLINPRNLNKSIANDKNHIQFLKSYRQKAQAELVQPKHTDFRYGGPTNRHVSQKYGKPYDKVFTQMLVWTSNGAVWEPHIPGSTIKGGFRKRASQILKTLWGETTETNDVLNRIFGSQGKKGLVNFSDAHFSVPEPDMFSMDSIRLDAKTGEPVEQAKRDMLYACGNHLEFHFQIELLDITLRDHMALQVLMYLVRDLQMGDIPFGGEKTSSFGWCQGSVVSFDWRRTEQCPDILGRVLAVDTTAHGPDQDGIWQHVHLEGNDADQAVIPKKPLVSTSQGTSAPKIPRSKNGFISHRSFGGYCGQLVLKGEVLTPLHVSESGEPSFRTQISDLEVNGWDMFKMAPPTQEGKQENQKYAIPSKSWRGAIRLLYTITSKSSQPSPHISKLNPVDSLFGWVGKGPNQALSARLAFGFGLFDHIQLAWFKVPHFYGHWHFRNGSWMRRDEREKAQVLRIDDHWRIFPHRPLAPCVQQQADFAPDDSESSYMRAALPGSTCSMTLRFWNLEQEELQRLLWCLVLTESMAHKIGKAKYLGFGSLRLTLTDKSYLLNLPSRYAGNAEEAWKESLDPREWLNPEVIAYSRELQGALDVGTL